MRQKLKRMMALGTVFLLILCALPFSKFYVQAAEEGNEILFTPVSYDITEEKMNINVTATPGDCSMAYFVYESSKMGAMSDEEKLEAATITSESSVDIAVNDKSDIYVWQLAKDAADTANVDSSSYARFICDFYNIMYKDTDNAIEFVNGDILESYNPNLEVGRDAIYFDSTLEAEKIVVYLSYNNVKKSSGKISSTGGRIEDKTFILDIEESGKYDITVWAVGDGVHSRAFRYTYRYEKPDRQIDSSAIDIKWSEETPGIVIVNTDSRLANYRKEATLMKASRNTPDSFLGGVVRSFKGSKCDFSKYINDENYVYTVKVRLISNDIENIAHSDFVYSDVYDPFAASGNVEETLAGILDSLGADSVEKADAGSLTELYNNADEKEQAMIAEALKEGLKQLPVNELKIAMQTSSDTRDTVAAVEAMTGVSVNVNVSGDAEGLVDKEGISIVGAALNVEEGGTNVSLNLTQPEESSFDNNQYKNAVPLGISLTGVQNAESELNVPVTITMPIPKGIDMSKLVILHLKQDGSVEETFVDKSGCLVDYDARTVTFTVTHFSTFVFAEIADQAPADNEDDDSSEDEDSSVGDTAGESADASKQESPEQTVTLPGENVSETENGSVKNTDNNTLTGAETAASTEKASPETGDGNKVEFFVMLMMLSILSMAFWSDRRVRTNR